ncbi:MAG: hypothetical protein M0Q91_06540 [Methanoregula sp.]|jgi:hypothetical protein|nr:hypothetical protein [Methanoregula sp.]
MDIQKPEIKFSKKWYNNPLYFAAYFLGMFLIPLMVNWLPLLFLFVIFPFIFILYIVTESNFKINTLRNQQFPENLDIKKEDHDAFIAIHSLDFFSIGSYIGMDHLISHYIRNRIPFKIYHCYNPAEFLEVLRNDKTKYIWIFGHGWRGGITFKWRKTIREFFSNKPKKTLFAYAKIRENLDQFPKKSFIGQFHCNHLDNSYPSNESLVEILSDSLDPLHYYITDDASHFFSIWFATRDLASHVKRESIPALEIQSDLGNNDSPRS